MKLYKEPFYTSHQVLYKGCFFHSMLELKFVLSIEDNFRFLREPEHICYDPISLKTYRKSSYLTRFYTPDFLIRHKAYGMVWLIEIKPDFLKGSSEVNYCEQIMKNFIAKNRLDWGTAIIYSSDIVLSEAKQKKFEIMRAYKDKYEEAIALNNFIRHYNPFGKSYYRSVPVHRADLITNRQYENFVRYGLLTKKRYGKT